MYDGLASGRVEVARLRSALAGLPLPRGSNGQLRFAVDVTPWPRPDAECSPDRLHCHRPCRCDGLRQTIPGWPYSVVAALESGRRSWTAPLDLLRLGPDDDLTEVTAGQIRSLIERLGQAGQWRPGDPPVLIVLDSGYDLPRLSWLLADLPVHLLGRIRADRVLYGPPGRRRGERPGRRPATAACSNSLPRLPTTSPSKTARAATTVSALCALGRGHGCTPRWNAAARGSGIPASSRSWKARLSTWRSIACPATASPSHCGCGPATPSRISRIWTGCGIATCVVSTWSTRFGFSSKLSVSPVRACAPPRKPTGGHG